MHHQQTSKAVLVTVLLMIGLALAPGVAGHHNSSPADWTCHRTVEAGADLVDCGDNPTRGGTRHVFEGDTMDFENDGIGSIPFGNGAFVQVTHHTMTSSGPVVFDECVAGPLPGGPQAVTSSGTWTVPAMGVAEWFIIEWFESCEQLMVTKEVLVCHGSTLTHPGSC